jgi:hypothetical protein
MASQKCKAWAGNLLKYFSKKMCDVFPEKYTEANMPPTSSPAPLTCSFEVPAVEELTTGSSSGHSLCSGESMLSAEVKVNSLSENTEDKISS